MDSFALVGTNEAQQKNQLVRVISQKQLVS